MGFSTSVALFVGITRSLTLSDPIVLPSISGRVAIVLSSVTVPVATLLEYRLFGSADAAEKEVRNDLFVSEPRELVVLVAVFVEVEVFVENGKKTVPNTRFAFSREASFLNSILNREGFLGAGGGG
jgi:hypothetical protein